MSGHKKKIQPLPFNYYYFPVVSFVCIGLASCVYLAIVHYKNYTDLTFTSICALSKTINCDTVAQSSHSILFNMPVALWGFFFFLFLLILTVHLRNGKNRESWWLFLSAGLAGCGAAVYYGYQSAVNIHAYCIFCIICYLSFFIITFYSFIIIRRFEIPLTFRTRANPAASLVRSSVSRYALIILVAAFLMTRLTLPHYWEMKLAPPGANVATGMTADGHPWIGARHPKITITEFSDYLCFQCYKMHRILRRLVELHPKMIRIVHYQYPLDSRYNPVLVKESFHVGAGKLALLAIRAAELGKFWQVNDAMFQIGRKKGVLDIRKLAAHVHIKASILASAFYDRKCLNALRRDVNRGLKLGITATPSFLIDGKVYTGTIPAALLKGLE